MELAGGAEERLRQFRHLRRARLPERGHRLPLSRRDAASAGGQAADRAGDRAGADEADQQHPRQRGGGGERKALPLRPRHLQDVGGRAGGVDDARHMAVDDDREGDEDAERGALGQIIDEGRRTFAEAGAKLPRQPPVQRRRDLGHMGERPSDLPPRQHNALRVE